MFNKPTVMTITKKIVENNSNIRNIQKHMK